jgi:beta-ketodecanoyl-[acyl-carrier-protein] synthase
VNQAQFQGYRIKSLTNTIFELNSIYKTLILWGKVMMDVVISATGVYLPPDIISNDELAKSFNAYAEHYNLTHENDIAEGIVLAMPESSSEFIKRASGIETRHVLDKSGILNIDTMHPELEMYDDNGVSIQAQIGIKAALKAMAAANKKASDIDMVIVSCSGFQRFYPAISIEIQHALGIEGFAFDMNVACSSVSFAIFNAYNAIKNGQVRAALIISPEIFTLQTNFRDRNAHFLFGDAAGALIIENNELCNYSSPYQIEDIQLNTHFSKNIISHFGLFSIHDGQKHFFSQEGKKVFKDVIYDASLLIQAQLEKMQVENPKIFWLHQANINMNNFIVKKILNRDPLPEEMPTPITYCGNVSSCGAIIAYDVSHQKPQKGDIGVFATFGAGYSFGSIILKKL